MKFFTFVTLLSIAISTVSSTIVPGTYFDRFFLIMFENTNYATAIKNAYLKDLTSRSNGLLLTNYFAVAHPSEPNYVATIFGSTAGVTNDGDYNITGQNLVDLLENKQISWKAYMEDYPGNCFTGDFAPSGTDNYARKHNPFISMQDISSNSARCAKIVPGTQLDADINANAVPQFAYYVPNQQNDGHDTGLSFAMNWFQGWFEPKLLRPEFTTNTLFFIVFDESGSGSSNQVFAGLLGSPVVPPGTHKDATSCNHYSILKTLENNWNLGNLGRNDVSANPFTTYLHHP
ncbi:9767_t:CDS:2 [Acaulospora morrowiae]|uniref:9767_t:CDS:1 n=1 Tax=Acaulospora morrowiae TaxID=94023 RepID=A0A9N9A9A4_9GLOM|nr:9767_t:CDS:2 [Acaulospora morrowiae]